MKINFVENKYKISNRFKDVISEKLARLDKYFGENAKATVVCNKQSKNEKLELTVANDGVLFRSEVMTQNMYDNIDLALPKLERQIVRNRDKNKQKKRNARVKDYGFEFLEDLPEFQLPEIFKKKVFDLEPTTLEDAKDAIERLGHTFFVFLNAETGKVNIIYHRNDGKYGLIEINY